MGLKGIGCEIFTVRGVGAGGGALKGSFDR